MTIDLFLLRVVLFNAMPQSKKPSNSCLAIFERAFIFIEVIVKFSNIYRTKNNADAYIFREKSFIFRLKINVFFCDRETIVYVEPIPERCRIIWVERKRKDHLLFWVFHLNRSTVHSLFTSEAGIFSCLTHYVCINIKRTK